MGGVARPSSLSGSSTAGLVGVFRRVCRTGGGRVFVSVRFKSSRDRLVCRGVAQTVRGFGRGRGDVRLGTAPVHISEAIRSDAFSVRSQVLRTVGSYDLVVTSLDDSGVGMCRRVNCTVNITRSRGVVPGVVLLCGRSASRGGRGGSISGFVKFGLEGLSRLQFGSCGRLISKLISQLRGRCNMWL